MACRPVRIALRARNTDRALSDRPADQNHPLYARNVMKFSALLEGGHTCSTSSSFRGMYVVIRVALLNVPPYSTAYEKLFNHCLMYSDIY